VDQPDLTGAFVYVVTAEPRVAGERWYVLPDDTVSLERRSGVFEPPSLIPVATLRTSWQVDG
jgi:hypothetical protein